MSATKIWNIGDGLTASDLNSNFTKLPYSVASFTSTYTGGALLINTQATVAIALPSSRFSVAPIVAVSCNDPYLTAYVSAISSGTATIGLRNNGNASSSGTVIITGIAIQATSGTAAG